jgi:hypothetical protein
MQASAELTVVLEIAAAPNVIAELVAVLEIIAAPGVIAEAVKVEEPAVAIAPALVKLPLL